MGLNGSTRCALVGARPAPPASPLPILIQRRHASSRPAEDAVNLEYKGQEQITADPAAVWAFVNDPEKIGHCLPDVKEVTVHDPTHFDVGVGGGVGPVRGKYKFKFELQRDDAARRMYM
jgi:hypothetical protein